MNAIYIPEIYGRDCLVNFDTVKFIQVSDNEENGDLIIIFTDKTQQIIPVSTHRAGAVDFLDKLGLAADSADAYR
ncbi:hypothetical protein DPK85_15285 [Salmonella enterica subsp. diarizonae]|nr:hypothetical protein [Salmonella enterica subsp. diarizonae]EDS6260668.1 hypothetical protein [Salmonella enterica subsp. diarizonae]